MRGITSVVSADAAEIVRRPGDFVLAEALRLPEASGGDTWYSISIFLFLCSGVEVDLRHSAWR
jgi:hypothetical protein